MSKDMLTRLAEELLANPTFTQAMSAAVQKGIETKGKLDRNIEAMLGLLNLPSRSDLTRLQTKLEVVQGTLVNLSIKVDRMLAAQNGGDAPSHPPDDARTGGRNGPRHD